MTVGISHPAVESFTEQGYAIVELLEEPQHRRLEQCIMDRLKEIARKELSGHHVAFEPLAEYHRLSVPEEAHRRMMGPNNRRLFLTPQDQQMVLSDRVAPIFDRHWGHHRVMISDLWEGKQVEGVCGFRVVRPGSRDVSGIHSESSYGVFPVTIWIPIVGFDERCTLQLAPGSHAISHPPEAIQRNDRFIARCYADDYVRGFQFIRPIMRAGQAIVFHPNLLHGGSDNQGQATRVSIEIRVYEANGTS